MAKKNIKPLPKLPRITKAEVTAWGVRIEVERGDKTIYHVEVVPHDQDVLLSFSFIGDRVIVADKTAANHVTVRMEDGGRAS